MKKLICLLLALAALFAVTLAGAEAKPALTFADISNLEWMFSSGVGAWYTCVWIGEDGTFTGEFHDSEMGETGEGYADGTVYGCLFHGKMTLGEQVDEYSWKVHVDELELDEGQVDEVIEDEMRFVTCMPYGLKAGSDMLLYLPGTPVDRLPEGFLPWAHLFEMGEDVKELPYYGLYDPQEENGFVGEPPYELQAEIVGAWRKEGGEASNAYTLLILWNDGTGTLMQMPEEIGAPLTWYPEGSGWTVWIASSDTAVQILYDADTDRLTLVEPTADGGQLNTVYCREWWDETE